MCTDLKPGSAQAHIYIENDRTRTTKWHFPNQGDNTGWHRHEYDYVVVPLFDGHLEILDAQGNRTLAAVKTGVPYYRTLGVEHDVINPNPFECTFIEIEFLESAKR